MRNTNPSRRKFLQLVGASVVAVTLLPKEIKLLPKISELKRIVNCLGGRVGP